MYEEIMQQHGMGDVRQLFEPVGGGPYPYVLTRDVGPVRFGDIVIAHPEGVVANSDLDESDAGFAVNSGAAEGYDLQQDQFADDMISSGDEGIGFAQARRLKRKLGRNRRRITAQGYAVESDVPYQFGDLGRSLFSRIKKFKFGRFLGRTVLPVAAGGLALKFAAPKLLGLAKRALRHRGTVAVPTAPGVPAPAPTGVTDATGAMIPPDIQAAMATSSTPSPIPAAAAAPTASEDVAAQAQDAETAGTMEAGVAGPFTMPNFSDPKVLLTLAGVGVLIFSQMGKRGGRRRSRRR